MEPRPEPSHTVPPAVPPGRSWPRRYNLVGLCFLSTFICYIDRVNISVAIIPMAEEFGWDQTTRGIVLSSFFYGYLATQVFGGWVADKLIESGLSVTFVRKLMQTIGFLGPTIFLSLIGSVSSAPQAIAYICCALGLNAFALAGFGVNHLDIGPRYAGILLGFSNTAGTIPGIVGVTLTGYLLDVTGSWGLVFSIAAGIYLFGLLVWLLFATGERVFE